MMEARGTGQDRTPAAPGVVGHARRPLTGRLLVVLLAGLLSLGALSLLLAVSSAGAQTSYPASPGASPDGESETLDPGSADMDDLMSQDDPTGEDGEESAGDGPPEDGSPEDGSPEDGSPEDGSPEDGSTEDGSPEDEPTDDEAVPEEGASEEEASEEDGDGGGSSSGACPDTGFFELVRGGLDQVAVNTLVCMLDWVYTEGIQAGGEEVSGYLAETAFGLPSPEGEMLSRYDEMVSFVKPGILVGILALGVMMMVQSANYNVAYGTQTGLPKLAFAAGALVFFPDLMRMVSDLSGSLATRFIGEAELARALSELIVAGVQSGGPLSVFMIIGQIAVLAIGALVVAVAIMKNILFAVLFIVGPLAMILSVVPGMSNVASAWIRGVVACAAIPLLYSLQVTIGSWAVNTPELIFGSAGGVLPVFKILGAVVLMYIMWKTPFKVIGWAFHSYSGPNIGSGMVGSIARGVAVSTIARGISGALAGGPAGAAAGAASGAAGGAASSAANGAAGGGAGAGASKPSMAAMQHAVGAGARNLPSSGVANAQADLMAKVQREGEQARAIRSAPMSMSGGIYSYGDQRGSGLTGGGAGGGASGSSSGSSSGAKDAGSGGASSGSRSGADSSRTAGGSGGVQPGWQGPPTTTRFGGHRAHILERKPKPGDGD